MHDELFVVWNYEQQQNIALNRGNILTEEDICELKLVWKRLITWKYYKFKIYAAIWHHAMISVSCCVPEFETNIGWNYIFQKSFIFVGGREVCFRESTLHVQQYRNAFTSY